MLLGATVIAAVTWHVTSIWRELGARGESVRIQPLWLLAAVALYLVALTVGGIWYYRVLHAGPTPIRAGAAVRAYLISHLGKYVPGKAMVVVMRSVLSASAGARPASAVLATLYETLVMMAGGSLMATLGYALIPSRTVAVRLGPLGEHPVSLLLLSAVMASGFLVMTSPWVFTRLAAMGSASLRGVGAGAGPRLSLRLQAEGLAWSVVIWSLLGASQYAVLRALGVEGIGWAEAPALVASVALATVAGFVVAVAPGGLGVREWVLWTSLGVLLDHDRAVLAALVLRLAWLIGELVAAGVCVILGRAELSGRAAERPIPRDAGNLGPS